MRRALLLLALALTACPAKGDKTKKGGIPPCTAFGQNCEFEPGKLGTCIRREGCTEGNCFICQSQH